MAIELKDNTDGTQAETLAAEYLQRQGLRILARNFRVKGGEIDLVASEGKSLVFVEVRLRRHRDFGGAGESITRAKRQRLILAARHWFQQHGESMCRFDCILLDRLDLEGMEWIKGAFSAD